MEEQEEALEQVDFKGLWIVMCYAGINLVTTLILLWCELQMGSPLEQYECKHGHSGDNSVAAVGRGRRGDSGTKRWVTDKLECNKKEKGPREGSTKELAAVSWTKSIKSHILASLRVNENQTKMGHKSTNVWIIANSPDM